MNKKMALDFGDVRIGIALSDMLGIIATGLESYTRKTLQEDIEHLVSIIDSNNVDTIVMGLPLNMDGTEGNRVEVTKDFANKLSEHTDAIIVYHDERLTSVEAEKILIQNNVSRQNRRKVIDKIAATIILQGYLDQF